MYIYIYTYAFITPRYSLPSPQRRIALGGRTWRNCSSSRRRIRRLGAINQAVGGDFPWENPMIFPWISPDFLGVLGWFFSCGKEIHDLFLRWNNIRTDFPHGKCLRWFSQRVSFNDSPWRPECEITTGYWKLVPQLVILSASYIGLQVGVSIKGGTPKRMVSHGKCQSKMDDLGVPLF